MFFSRNCPELFRKFLPVFLQFSASHSFKKFNSCRNSLSYCGGVPLVNASEDYSSYFSGNSSSKDSCRNFTKGSSKFIPKFLQRLLQKSRFFFFAGMFSKFFVGASTGSILELLQRLSQIFPNWIFQNFSLWPYRNTFSDSSRNSFRFICCRLSRNVLKFYYYNNCRALFTFPCILLYFFRSIV